MTQIVLCAKTKLNVLHTLTQPQDLHGHTHTHTHTCSHWKHCNTFNMSQVHATFV